MAAQPHEALVQRASFSSDDDGEVTEFIRRMYADNTSRFAPIRHGAQFSAQTYDTPVIGVDHVRTSIDYAGTSDEGFRDYVFFVVHAGSVRMNSSMGDVIVAVGDAAFYPLDTPIAFAMQGFDVTTMRLGAAQVARIAEETTGIPAAEFGFHGITPISESMARFWRSLLALVSGAITDPVSPLTSKLLADELARMVAVSALHVFPNTAMTRHYAPGPGVAASATIRRAVAYLEANADQPIQLSDIAAAAGCSARALQYGFRRSLDTTPLAYLRRVRLERARQELQAADPTQGDTVAAVAARWGFGNAGRFASDYRAAYGTSPGQTLRS